MLRHFMQSFRTARFPWQLLFRDDSGSVLTFLVAVPMLAGALAIGLETGQLYSVQRKMQAAADAAALAGALDRIAGKNGTTITTDARYEAQRNGFTNGVGSVVVTVNAPPTSGPNTGTTGAVEVIVTKTQSLSFGTVVYNWMSKSTSGFSLRARSVAAQGSSVGTSAEGCIVALTSAAEQGIQFTSFNSFNSDCTMISNGTSSSANSSASVYLSSFNNATMKSVWSRGSFYASSYNSLSLTNAAQVNQATAVTDPYAGLGTPSPGGCTFNLFVPIPGSSVTLTPGTYCGGLSVSSFNTVYLTAGTYYIADGDLTISSVNSVSCLNCVGGAGVTFVLTQTSGNNTQIKGVTISSLNSITLSAPSSGTYAGVLFYQDSRAQVGTMNSASRNFKLTSLNNVVFNGAIYFPNNNITVSSLNSSGSSSTGCTVWIGRYINFTSYNSNYIAGCATYGTTPASISTSTPKGKLFE